MEQANIHDDGDGTRRRLQPSPSATVPEEDDPFDLPDDSPLWAAGPRCYICMVLMVILSALTDFAISTYLVPCWGWFIFEWSLLLVPIGTILYKLNECLIASEPPPCMR
ncbi:hypothetical protein HPB52_016654 [Rhipicephalus sanguineus]|uniref:Uncharacterized protein n=1 Tax=Rhipicephalus sanguineus TaxID=34632 RepID=A0A9D4PX52_RHISA|nr:hypothetical protein HPB52_016654 [Rhipicephalus sanguineus]